MPNPDGTLTAAELQEARLALALHSALINDPETRKDHLKLIKKKFPQASLPELDAAAPIETELGALGKKLEESLAEIKAENKKLRDELATEKKDAQINQQFVSLKTSRGYTDEGIANIQELMKTKFIADPEAAADHFDRLNYKPPPIEPSSYSGTSYLNVQDDGVKSWINDPDGNTDRIIGEVLTEARAGKL